MQIDLDKAAGNIIRSVSEHGVLIGDELFCAPVIVATDRIFRDWAPRPVEELLVDDFQPLVALEPEVILVGTGSRQRFPAMATSSAILNQGIGLEFMTTAAACRTFNVLASEYRRVVAGLFIA